MKAADEKKKCQGMTASLPSSFTQRLPKPPFLDLEFCDKLAA